MHIQHKTAWRHTKPMRSVEPVEDFVRRQREPVSRTTAWAVLAGCVVILVVLVIATVGR